jgi:hypothetical protein
VRRDFFVVVDDEIAQPKGEFERTYATESTGGRKSVERRDPVGAIGLPDGSAKLDGVRSRSDCRRPPRTDDQPKMVGASGIARPSNRHLIKKSREYRESIINLLPVPRGLR